MKKSENRPKEIPSNQDMEKIFEDLELVESSFRSSSKLRGYLENPRIAFDQKTKAIKNIFKDYISNEAYDFIFLLLRSNALGKLTDILRNYRRAGVETGVLELEVKTAIPLSPEDKIILTQRFSKKLGRPLMIRNVVDTNIIGGMVIKVGDIMIDASINSKMNTLLQQMRQG